MLDALCDWPPSAEDATTVDFTCENAVASRVFSCRYDVFPPNGVGQTKTFYARCVSSRWQVLQLPCPSDDASADTAKDSVAPSEAAKDTTLIDARSESSDEPPDVSSE